MLLKHVSSKNRLMTVSKVCLATILLAGLSTVTMAGVITLDGMTASSLVAGATIDMSVDGTPEPSILPATSADIIPGYNYEWYELWDADNPVSVAHSGSILTDEVTYQHVYGYSKVVDLTEYVVNNLLNRQAIYDLTASSSKKKYDKVKGTTSLPDLSLVVVRKEGEKNQVGLLASFSFETTREFVKSNGKAAVQKLVKGTVELIGLKNGKIRIKTKGKIKKLGNIVAVGNDTGGTSMVSMLKDIIAAQKGGSMLQIDLSNLVFDYKVRLRNGSENTIKTVITSSVGTIGTGSGSEVVFASPEEPAEAVVPEFQELGDDPVPSIPEPLTVVLLGLGGLVVATSKRHRFA